eukprot:m51a1_g9158 putative tesmin tso1-like cxc domain-containing protein (448) ;mRNA; r:132692-134322
MEGSEAAAAGAAASPGANSTDTQRSGSPASSEPQYSPRAELSCDSSSNSSIMASSCSLPPTSSSLSCVPHMADSMPALEPRPTMAAAATPAPAQRGRKRRANSMDATTGEASAAAASIAASWGERPAPSAAPAAPAGAPGATAAAAAAAAAPAPAASPRCKRCNCKNSRCLKLYCECFASRQYCSGCTCAACCNRPTHREELERAIKSTLERNPNAFQPKIDAAAASPAGGSSAAAPRPRHNRGCHCRRTGCLKGYCECFQAGVRCSAACKCVDCRNYEGSEFLKALETSSAPSPAAAAARRTARLSATASDVRLAAAAAVAVTSRARRASTPCSAPPAACAAAPAAAAAAPGSPAPAGPAAAGAAPAAQQSKKCKTTALSRVLAGYLSQGAITDMAQSLVRGAAGAPASTAGAQESSVMHEFASFLNRTADAIAASAGRPITATQQ